jgi:S-adenosyl-L-methionine hydrolase (adenosine-forming)
MHRPIICLTTDFGEGSPYVAAMKGVILSLAPDVNLVDVTHAVPPQDIRNGALILADLAELFPPGTIHIAVVDPGVGTSRAIVWAEIAGRQYIAPDNGLLGLLAHRNRPTRIRTLAERAWWRQTVSDTFHGRDIMAPVAAQLALGLDPERLGPPRDALVELDWPEVRTVPGKIQGSVTRVDSFGNLITDITADMLAGTPRGEETRVACGDHETCGIFRAYADQPEMTFIALVGSGGQLELAIVGDSAAAMLGIEVGTEVTVAW